MFTFVTMKKKWTSKLQSLRKQAPSKEVVLISHFNNWFIFRFKSIMHSLSGDGFGKILVFTNTKRFVDMLSLMLRRNGWPAVGIHGDKSQLQRDTIINKFKHGQTNILVATDVAARGLGKQCAQILPEIIHFIIYVFHKD